MYKEFLTKGTIGYFWDEKNMEWGLRVWREKREVEKKERKKILKGKKLNWFYLYVHFVWCKV